VRGSHTLRRRRLLLPLTLTLSPQAGRGYKGLTFPAKLQYDEPPFRVVTDAVTGRDIRDQ